MRSTVKKLFIIGSLFIVVHYKWNQQLCVYKNKLISTVQNARYNEITKYNYYKKKPRVDDKNPFIWHS